MTTQQQDDADEPGPVNVTARACPDWLGLRRAADTQARDTGAGPLLELLVDHLRGRGAGAVRVVDVGAGTGANHAYLSPRLPLEQSWVVVDHDADLLAHAGHGNAVRVEAGVQDLVRVLEELVGGDQQVATVLTCAALLDVLTTRELACLADAVERSGAPALLSLSVTGGVHWSPPDPADPLVAALFDGHQRQGGRPGPQAAAVLVDDLRSRGLRVHSRPTPWVLDHREPELLARWLDERAEAALDQLAAQDGHGRDGSRQRLTEWLARRREQAGSARLVAQIDHVDLLVLPHRPQRAPGGARRAP
jgi:SAM-dependent methyltransferase